MVAPGMYGDMYSVSHQLKLFFRMFHENKPEAVDTLGKIQLHHQEAWSITGEYYTKLSCITNTGMLNTTTKPTPLHLPLSMSSNKTFPAFFWQNTVQQDFVDGREDGEHNGAGLMVMYSQTCTSGHLPPRPF